MDNDLMILLLVRMREKTGKSKASPVPNAHLIRSSVLAHWASAAWHLLGLSYQGPGWTGETASWHLLSFIPA